MNLKDLTTDELYNIAAKVYEFNGDATGTQVGYRREGFVQGVIYALGQTPPPEGVKPEVNPKDISHAIFLATHERGWFHEKDALDILSKYTITAK